MGALHYELAYQSLLACCKADPKNMEARKELESMKETKTAVKPGFISKQIDKEQRWEGGVYDTPKSVPFEASRLKDMFDGKLHVS